MVKAGVSTAEELRKFVQEAGDRLLVVDGEYNTSCTFALPTIIMNVVTR